MQKLLASVILLVICDVASADELVLRDGRTFNGTVTVKDDAVLVQMPYGTLSFSRDQVLRIDIKDRSAHNSLPGLAQNSRQGLVASQEPALGVLQPGRIGNVVQQSGLKNLAHLQRFLRAFALGNVLEGALVMENGAASVKHHMGVYADPDDAAVFAVIFLFKSFNRPPFLQQTFHFLPFFG